MLVVPDIREHRFGLVRPISLEFHQQRVLGTVLWCGGQLLLALLDVRLGIVEQDQQAVLEAQRQDPAGCVVGVGHRAVQLFVPFQLPGGVQFVDVQCPVHLLGRWGISCR